MGAEVRHIRLSGSLVPVVVSVLVCAGSPATPTVWGAEPGPVAILYSQQKSYVEAVSAIDRAVKQAGHTCVLIELPKDADKAARDRTLKRLADAKPTVVAASGATATTLALKTVRGIPVIFFMLPNALDASFMAAGSRDRARVAGVTTDASPKEQIDWMRKLHPASRNIAVLHSPRSKRTVEAIKASARPRGIEIVPIEAKKDRFPKAIETLNKKRCDGVLMIADARVYNSPNVRRLLLWGMRQKKPVWAFSANVVKAGALAGLCVDGKAIGQQTAALIEKVIAGADVKRIGLQYASPVRLAVNERTAQAIGVPLAGKIPAKGTIRYGARR